MDKKDRKEHLNKLKNEFRTMVFYKQPHSLHRTLCNLYENLGKRKIVIVKQLTKVPGSTDYTKLSEDVTRYKR